MSGPSGWEPIGGGGKSGGSGGGGAWEPIGSGSSSSSSTGSSGGGGGGGFFGDIKSFAGGAGHYIAHQASVAGHTIKQMPGGLWDQANQAVVQPWWNFVTTGHPYAHGQGQKIDKVVNDQLTSIDYTLSHPGANLLATGMLVAPALHGVGRVGVGGAEAAQALGRGEGLPAAVKAFKEPALLRTPRTLAQPGGEPVTLATSRNVLRRAYQGAHDAYVQKMIDNKPESVVAKYGASRMHGTLSEITRARVRMRQAVVANLRRSSASIGNIAKGSGLKLENAPKTLAQAAIELVSHNTTPEEASIRAQAAIEHGINPELNAANLRLYHEVQQLDLVHTLGRDVGINPEFEHLAHVEQLLHEGASTLDTQIAERGLRPAAQLENRRNLPAAVTQRLKPFTEGKITPAMRSARANFERVDAAYQKSLKQEADWRNGQGPKNARGPQFSPGGKRAEGTPEQSNPYRNRIVQLGMKHEEALQRLQRLEAKHGATNTAVPEDLLARQELIKFVSGKFGKDVAKTRIGLLDQRAAQFARENDVPAAEFYRQYLKHLETPATIVHLPEDIAPLYEAAKPLEEQALPHVAGADIVSRIAKTGDLNLPKNITPEQFAAIIDQTVMPLVQQGAPYRDWYARGAKVIKDAAKRLGVPVRRMIDLVAVTSQGANPTFNLRLATKAVREFQQTGKVTKEPLPELVQIAKEKFGAKDKPNQPVKGWSGYLHDPSEAQASLEGKTIETIKRNSYRGNFLHEIDPKQFAKEYGARIDPVTVDRHIARMFGFGSSPSPAQYALVERVFQEIAKDLGWRAKEVQAAAWVPWKARNEMQASLARATKAGRGAQFDQSLGRFMPNAADAYEAGHAENIGVLYQAAFHPGDSLHEPMRASRGGPRNNADLQRLAGEAPRLQHVLDTNAGQDLVGLPRSVKVNGEPIQWHSFKEAQDIASNYMQEAGLPYDPPRTYAKVDPARAARIAQWYDEAIHAPTDPAVAAAYDAMARETLAQYGVITKAGYKFEFYPPHDPYPGGPREAILDLVNNKHMYVYPTVGDTLGVQSFGTETAADSAHPLLTDSGVRWNGQKVTHNDVFRAVHDFFGHAKEGVGFRADGEENAWRSHSAMYTPQARAAMTAETRGQNSWVNFGPHGEANRTASQLDTVYADQKAVVAPSWVVHDGAGDAGNVPPQELFHEDDINHAILGSYERQTATMRFASEHAIPETVTHEALHAIRQSLPELLQRKFEARYGIEGGQWSRAHEEKFVEDMLGVANGTVADPEIVRMYHQLTDFVPGRSFTPLTTLDKGTPSSPMARASGPVIGEAQDPLNRHFTTGEGLLSGRHQADVVDSVARHWHNVFRFFNTQDWRDVISKTGSDTRRSSRDILVRTDNRTEGGGMQSSAVGKITPELDKLIGRVRDTSYTPQMEGDEAGIMASVDQYVNHLFPGRNPFSHEARLEQPPEAGGAALGEAAPAGYKWVDSQIAGVLDTPRIGAGNVVGRFMDNLNSAVTAATVYFKIGHVTTRVLTNAATNIMQGSATPLNIREAVGVWHELSPAERLDALASAGTHYYESIPGAEGTGRVSRIVQHGVGKSAVGAPQWWARVVDAPFRFNSLAYEVRKSAYGGGVDAFRQFQHDLKDYNNLEPAQRAEVDGVVRRANREAIAYDRLNSFEKSWLSRAIWFYPWVKGSTVWTASAMFEHPFKSAALVNQGVIGMQKQQKDFGDVPSYSYGLFQLAHGQPFPLAADFSTFNPEATAGDLLQVPSHFNDLGDMLNPAVGMAQHIATSTDQYGSHTNHPLTSAVQGLVSATPESQIAQAFIGRHADQSHREFPGGPSNDLWSKTWLGEVLRMLLGPGAPRRFNPEAAHSLAQRERTGR